ncbi:isoprenylcysteine carboxylmethyltransferase family protein [Cognatishimia sp. F0-27]|uniref:methyltransferase family protein n=1 Tax=Cognatishimia sp. F0-27 TaxID=2816855 RepID=UPI001D0CBBC2|nr:isoprenylcysteine carboxylmethyltransferase family protein [Cognatishimia sp. F0-27]MCC1493627.1 isoprenylcysteine carboxylmethyltransferase family protein [Cognatishimia sp. F0-27]
MLKWIDLPPVWLLACLVIAWTAQGAFGLTFGGAWADFAGGLLVGGGILLMVFAVMALQRHKTTVIPHQEADTLVVSGVFKLSRNPIYLGDCLLLAGLILRWDAVVALPLLPVFVWVIERRFILPEEKRLRRKFRASFAKYTQQTRRWL